MICTHACIVGGLVARMANLIISLIDRGVVSPRCRPLSSVPPRQTCWQPRLGRSGWCRRRWRRRSRAAYRVRPGPLRREAQGDDQAAAAAAGAGAGPVVPDLHRKASIFQRAQWQPGEHGEQRRRRRRRQPGGHGAPQRPVRVEAFWFRRVGSDDGGAPPPYDRRGCWFFQVLLYT